MPSPDEWQEADMLAEEILGRPKRPAAEGIAAMQERCAHLQGRIESLLARADSPSPGGEGRGEGESSALAALQRELLEAQRQLAEYQHQHGARN